MKYIAHRGNLFGPSPLENTIPRIRTCLHDGYDVEIDVHYVDGQFWLGHDEPKDIIDVKFMLEHRDKLWIHAKNKEALFQLQLTNDYNEYTKFQTLNYFWHNKDDYTLTSHRHIWAYPGSAVNNQTVVVMPEWYDSSEDIKKAYAICSDYIVKYSNERFINK